MVFDEVKHRNNSQTGGLESLILKHPPSHETRNSLLMLVTSSDDRGDELQTKLVSLGHIVARLPTFALAAQYANKAYVDGIVVDARNTVTTKADVKNNPAAYTGTGEIYTFLNQVRSIDPDLGVLLVTTSEDPNEYHIPAINDMIQSDVKVTRSKDEAFRPFAANELSEQPFSSLLTSLLNNRMAHLTERISKVSSSLPNSPSNANLPIDVGEAVAQVYNRLSTGGTAFITDSITVGGAFAPINPFQQYNSSAKAFHIKRVTEAEGVRFAETYDALIKRFRELEKGKPKTPAPLGYHVTAEGAAFSVRSFVIGSSYSEIAKIINPNSPQHVSDPDGLYALLWHEMLRLAFGKKIPEWYEVTHSIILEERHTRAREVLLTRQADHLLLVPEHLPEIIGKSMDQKQKQDYRAAVADLYLGFPISDASLVLPMSSKGQNLALETFQTIPTAELLRKRYMTGDRINAERLERDFAFWDYNILGRAGTVFSDIYSLVNDPRVNIPQAERPKWMFTALQAIFSEDEIIPLYDELFRQGVHHSMLKAQQTAIHAQVNEYRLAIGRVRDTTAYEEEKKSLQSDFNYFLGEAIKHITLFCTAKAENWTAQKLTPDKVVDLMTEHYTNPDNWLLCSVQNGKSRSFGYLKQLHTPIALMYTEPELSRLDTEELRKNALYGNFLAY